VSTSIIDAADVYAQLVKRRLDTSRRVRRLVFLSEPAGMAFWV